MSDRTPEAFTLVVFYRGLHCPKCKDQLTELDRRLDDLAAVGITDVVAVSGDTAGEGRQDGRRLGAHHLTVGHSLSERTMREWGLFVSAGINDREPALFNEPAMALVRPDGTLYSLWVQSTPFARPHLDQILSSTPWVLENDYPARGEN